MKNHFRLLLFVLFLNQHLFATTITGRITDATTQQPLESVSVFLASTTIGTYTDAEGRFRITSNGEEDPGRLIASHIGYENFAVNLKKGENEWDIALQPKEHVLQSIQINAKDSHREQNMKAFLFGFFGNSKFGKNCTILNPGVIHLKRTPLSRINQYELTASADSAIIIENKMLGYTIRYMLVSFRQTSIETSFVGYPLFMDNLAKIKKPEKTLKAREEAYAGSAMHFIRCLYKKNYENQGFLLYKTKMGSHMPILDNRFGLLADSIFMEGENGKHLIQTDEKLDLTAYLYFKNDCLALLYDEPFEIRYTLNGEDHAYRDTRFYYSGIKREYGQQTTLVKLIDGQAIFFRNGSLKDPESMVTIGYWSYKKLGETLPWDYRPREKEMDIPNLSPRADIK